MSWGRGGMVGVRKSIWRHEQTMKIAQDILTKEHGIKHKDGEHELCPICQQSKAAIAKANQVTIP